jgi:hypothetical protein
MALAPTAAGIDDIAVKLSQEQESILDRLRHELDSIAIESNTKKDQNKKGPGRQRTRYLSAALLSTTPWTALSRTKMLTSGREGEMPDDDEVWARLKKARAQIDVSSRELRLRPRESTVQLEDGIKDIFTCLGSLENSRWEVRERTQIFSKIGRAFSWKSSESSRIEIRQSWICRLKNAKGCANLLQDTINVSRYIETVSETAVRRTWLEDPTITHPMVLPISASVLLSEVQQYIPMEISDFRNSSAPRTETDEENIRARSLSRAPASSSIPILESVGAWADSQRREFPLIKATTW